eukprot:8679531-Pyramimonas_sp.AAC.2
MTGFRRPTLLVCRPRGQQQQNHGGGASRRNVVQTMAMASWLTPWMNNKQPSEAAPKPRGSSTDAKPTGPTNEVVQVVNGIRHKRLGAGDIFVSELGLGTQRW